MMKNIMEVVILTVREVMSLNITDYDMTIIRMTTSEVVATTRLWMPVQWKKKLGKIVQYLNIAIYVVKQVPRLSMEV